MEYIESLFIEICRAKGKNFVVGVIYWSPNQNVNELMAKISLENKFLLYNGWF